MCLFGSKDVPQDNSAAIARQQEQERQARIAQGETAIDDAFSRFDDPFFSQFTDSYLNYYQPQLQQQFGNATDDLRLAFARKGNLNGTAASDNYKDLANTFVDASNNLSSKALAATNDLKSDVNTRRNNLSTLNATSADPSAVARQAVSSAGAVQETPTFSPLANIFAGVVDGYAANQAGRQNALPPGYQQLFAPGAFSTTSSGRVVA